MLVAAHASTASPVEIARGVLLLGVLHVHALYALLPAVDSTRDAAASLLQMKMLTPHVVLFFALAGMTSRRLGDKPLRTVVHQSLLLLFIGAATHVLGMLVEHALWVPWSGWRPLLRDVGKPLLLGTGMLSMAWFFVTLAVARLFAYAWTRSTRAFVAAAAIACVLIAASLMLGGPNNLYEWRNWPAAFVAFMIGQHVNAQRSVPHAVGLPSALAGIVLPLTNHPQVLAEGPCLACHIEFIAYPTIGSFGFAPLYFVQELLALIGLLWLVGLIGPSRLGHLLAWFGHRSLVLLMLHSLIASALYGLYKAVDPPLDGAFFFLLVLFVNPLAHYTAYRLLHKPANGFVALATRLARRVVSSPRRPIMRRA
jgi:peptidoglycan/LPS O-acetylase OafA/YrhL